ncbi:hypothetical protein BKA82DRAFT_4354307 [Pisolithus tinctorius]|nr:hypothetical protein BKA82DRAFT_4354307 [Pisolithus tinctorius]
MAYFTLSSEEMFRKAVGGLIYGDFYCMIILLFEEKETDLWVKETLAWWNQQIYGNNSSKDLNSNLVNSVSIDPVLRGASATASTSSVHNGMQATTTVSSGIALSSVHNGTQTVTTINTESAFPSAHNGMQTATTININILSPRLILLPTPLLLMEDQKEEEEAMEGVLARGLEWQMLQSSTSVPLPT